MVGDPSEVDDSNSRSNDRHECWEGAASADSSAWAHAVASEAGRQSPLEEPAGKASLPNTPFHRNVTSHFACSTAEVMRCKSHGRIFEEMQEGLPQQVPERSTRSMHVHWACERIVLGQSA